MSADRNGTAANAALHNAARSPVAALTKANPSRAQTAPQNAQRANAAARASCDANAHTYVRRDAHAANSNKPPTRTQQCKRQMRDKRCVTRATAQVATSTESTHAPIIFAPGAPSLEQHRRWRKSNAASTKNVRACRPSLRHRRPSTKNAAAKNANTQHHWLIEQRSFATSAGTQTAPTGDGGTQDLQFTRLMLYH